MTTTHTHPLRRIFTRFFPKKGGAPAPFDTHQWERLSSLQKQELALRYLSQGELALLQGNLNALSLFEAASQLDPTNPQIWYRQGLSFSEYGAAEGREKALLLASKHFKISAQLDPASFETWVAWGNALLQLGRFHFEHHFLLEAKEKFQKALELAPAQSREALAELFWDRGLVCSEIARHSGEALDLRLAIEAFQASLTYQEEPPSPEFLADYGKAYFELGLLVNDTRFYLRAIDFLSRATALSPAYFEGWMALADAYAQLYLNTMEERHAMQASECLGRAASLSPHNSDVWLNWAEILGEAGHLSKDPKLLKLSIEKCVCAAKLDERNPFVTAQWVESLAYLGLFTARLDLMIEAEQKILRATETFPDDPELWRAYGICCTAFGMYYQDPDYYEMAIEKLQIGLSMDRTNAELWHSLGLVHKLYANLTNHEDLYERAHRFFARAIDLKPSYPPLIFDTACSLLHFSELADHLPSLEKAISYFDILLHQCKEVLFHHPEWLYEYGYALEWLGDYSGEEIHFTRAIDVFSHILLLDPDFPHIHFRLAFCYVELAHLTEESEYYRRALHFFRLASRQDEENDQVWLDWGVCLIYLAHHTLDTELMNQLYWDAEQKITRAGSLGNPNAYYNLACLYSILGRTQEAIELIQKALNARALPKIEEMLDDEWLDNLRATEAFAQFLNALEAKLQAREE